MNEKKKAAIKEILEKHGVVLGYLFGSAARGERGPLSDVDVAVVFDDHVPKEEYFDREIALSSKLESALGEKQVDVVNLKKARSPLLKLNVIAEGEPIFVRDNALRFRTEREIVREYEDARFLHDIAASIMKEQLKDGTFGKSRLRTTS